MKRYGFNNKFENNENEQNNNNGAQVNNGTENNSSESKESQNKGGFIKNHKTSLIVTGAAVTTTILGYVGYKVWKKRKTKDAKPATVEKEEESK